MATVGTVTVDQMIWQISDDGGTTFEAVACQIDASFNLTRNMIEQICKDTGGGVSYKPGLVRWDGSGTAYFAYDSAFGAMDLVGLLLAGTKIKVKFGTTATGDKVLTGDAYVSGTPLSSSGGADEFVQVSFNIQGEGVPTVATNA